MQARTTTLALLQTLAGHAEIKRERDAMKREKKLKPRHKVDLETQAMEAAFAAFDTDGSGAHNHVVYAGAACMKCFA